MSQSYTKSPPNTTGYPFNHDRDAFISALESIPTVDLIAEVEAWQWLALSTAGSDSSREYCELQLEAILTVLERRQRLLKDRKDDPLRPAWPSGVDALRRRIDAVKVAWPIERFCRELLLLDLVPAGNGRWKSRCPLPGHQDRTPSFVIYPDDHGWCFGCSRGGDVLKLAQYVLNTDRFTEALRLLEGVEVGR